MTHETEAAGLMEFASPEMIDKDLAPMVGFMKAVELPQNSPPSHEKQPSHATVLMREQNALQGRLERIWSYHYRNGTGMVARYTIDMKAKAKCLHVEALMAAGFTKSRAWESAEQCDELARMVASHADYMGKMATV